MFTIAESPLEKGVIWAGSDDGLVHVTRDGGGTWTNVTPKGMPEWTRVSIIEASHHAKGTAYLAGEPVPAERLRARISTRPATTGRPGRGSPPASPASEFTRVIREDPIRPGLLYAGTERGVWVSFNDGASWQRLQRNLPPVPVHDLAVKEGDLVAATHGRAFWILDDISALRQLAAEVLAKDAHLFQPRDTYRIGGFFGSGWLRRERPVLAQEGRAEGDAGLPRRAGEGDPDLQQRAGQVARADSLGTRRQTGRAWIRAWTAGRTA